MVVNRGTLRRGAVLVAGTSWGRVKTIHDEFNRSVDEAGPSCPVRVTGWREELPPPGEIVLELSSDERAKEVSDLRMGKEMEKKQEEDMEVIEQKRAEHHEQYKASKLTLFKKGWRGGSTVRSVISKQHQWRRWDAFDPNAKPVVAIILRCDVDGTLEAITNVLATYDCDDVELNLLDFDVGPPSELNVEMAEKFNAMIVCFNVAVPAKIRALSAEKGVDVEQFNVIYKFVDRLKDLLSAKLPPVEEYKQLGEGHVLKQFMLSDGGKKRKPVAGVMVDSGFFDKSKLFRITRRGSNEPEVIYEGSVESLKHEKEFVSRIGMDNEVGIALADKDIHFSQDDVVECIEKSTSEGRIKWEPPGF